MGPAVFIAIFLGLAFYDVSVGLEVKFLNILFRHGDRTPSTDPYESPRNSPYADYPFEPYGRGQLTNRGKLREYALGERIRAEYNDFLGDIYRPGAVFSQSSDFDRTKMSLQLVLAGMFAPPKSQQWHRALNWQPTIANYLKRSEDLLLFASECPGHKKEINAVLKQAEVQREILKFSGLGKQLRERTGMTFNTSQDFLSLYNGLKSLQSLGLELPRWAAGIFPTGPLQQAAALHYRVMNHNQRLRTLNGGMIIKNFTDNMVQKIQGDKFPDLKVVILSGHETNVGFVLNNLAGFRNDVPAYSSAVFVELVEDDNDYYVRVNYYVGDPATIEPITIPGCGRLCPLKEFIALYEGIFPSENDMIC